MAISLVLNKSKSWIYCWNRTSSGGRRRMSSRWYRPCRRLSSILKWRPSRKQSIGHYMNVIKPCFCRVFRSQLLMLLSWTILRCNCGNAAIIHSWSRRCRMNWPKIVVIRGSIWMCWSNHLAKWFCWISYWTNSVLRIRRSWYFLSSRTCC